MRWALGSLFFVGMGAVLYGCGDGISDRHITHTVEFLAVDLEDLLSQNYLYLYQVNQTDGSLTETAHVALSDPSAVGVSMTISPDQHFAYILGSGGSAQVFGYAISQSGLLTEVLGGAVTVDVSANDIKISPDGNILQVVAGHGATPNWATLSRNTTTGKLGTPSSVLEDGNVALGQMLFAPDGKHAYVVELGAPHGLAAHAILGDGSPDPTSIVPVQNLGGGNIGGLMAITPDGTLIYAPDTANHIQVCTVNPSTGVLGAFTTAFNYGSGTSGDVVVSPDGLDLYATTNADGHVHGFAVVSGGGALSEVPGSPASQISCGTIHQPVVTASGKWIYAICLVGDQLIRVPRNPVTGAMGAADVSVTPGWVGANLSPRGIRVVTVTY